jgi:hypothetical protein
VIELRNRNRFADQAFASSCVVAMGPGPIGGLGALLGAAAGAEVAAAGESVDACARFGFELLLQNTSATRMISAPTAIAIKLIGSGALCCGSPESWNEAGGSGLAFASLGDTPGMFGCWGLKGSTFFSIVTLRRSEWHFQIEWAVVEMQDHEPSRVLSLSHAQCSRADPDAR